MTVKMSRLPKCSKLVDDSEDDSMSRLPKCSKLVADNEGDTISRLPKCSKLESVLIVTIPEETGQFFIVVRRASNFTRCLNLWRRESIRTTPDKF